VEGGEVVGPEWQLTFHHPNGGGLHPVERDGVFVFEWGRGQKRVLAPR
jgi:hypothetical protein